ncbi:cache domain-containing protein, partial [Roseisolibacter sp. H3M3-2]|uniref:cache domain-containing protein n=1 Tax=Roseisolibacter sp. H3M3-2 TaxID=3031323 RepID=UPI0023DBD952
ERHGYDPTCRAAAADATRGLEQAADLTAQLLAGRGRALAGGARVFVQGPYFRALVAGQRRDDLLDQAFEAAGQLEAAWVFITDERGVLLAKSDEPGAFGAAMGAIPLVAGALEGRETSGFGASRDTLLFQTVCLPVVVPGAAPVGTLTATRVVDARLARDVRAATGTDVVFYTVDPAGRRRVAAATLPRALADTLVADTAAHAGRWRRQQAALVTAGGEVVGGYMVLRAAAGVPSGLAAVRGALL